MRKGSDPMREVFFSLCKEIDTPISLSAWLRFKYSHKEYLSMAFHPRDYLEKDRRSFLGDYAVISALSKYKGLDVGIDLEAVALQKFIISEDTCRETNRRLSEAREVAIDATISSRLFRAKRKISKLLGPCSLHCISPFFGWGPGATHDIPRARALVDTKMTSVPITVGVRSAQLLSSVIRDDLHWSSALLGLTPEGPFDFVKGTFEFVETCRVTTVPKNAKTDRVIAIEPTGNLFLQKGVGGYFRRRLKRVGVDLDDQTINQSLAAKAVEAGLATLDLRAASDSVSRELVYELLPVDWAILLDSLRSHSAALPSGEVVRLEKFSSMGNGFTFELESLIFWALSTSVLEDRDAQGTLAVYGDDLIINEDCAPDLIRLLDFAGFATNEEKTFIDGLFRESCGKHYFNGYEVTPFYQKENVDNDIECIRLHNRVVRWAMRSDFETHSQMPAYRAAGTDYSNCLLPTGVEGDDGFLVPIEVLLEEKLASNPNLGFRCRGVRSVTRSLPGIEIALLALHLRKSYCETSTQVDHLGFRDDLYGAKPCYGDVEIAAREETLALEHTFGYRWVIPPGYCPLPAR